MVVHIVALGGMILDYALLRPPKVVLNLNHFLPLWRPFYPLFARLVGNRNTDMLPLHIETLGGQRTNLRLALVPDKPSKAVALLALVTFDVATPELLDVRPVFFHLGGIFTQVDGHAVPPDRIILMLLALQVPLMDDFYLLPKSDKPLLCSGPDRLPIHVIHDEDETFG